MSKILDQSVDDGVAQLINSPNQWAIDMWRTGNANHWNPLEVDMSTDIKQWNSEALSEDEKLLVKRTLGLFSAGESLVSNSIFSVERIFITDGCCRQYLARKDFEECLPAGTLVKTDTGFIPIEDVTISTKVMQYNRFDDRFELDEVTELNYIDKAHFLIHVYNDNGFSLKTSINHRWLVFDGSVKGKVLLASQIQEGDNFKILKYTDDNLEYIEGPFHVNKIKYERPVYCLTVKHRFFVIKDEYGNEIVTGNSLHNMTVSVCCEAYNLDPNEVAEAYKNIDAVKNKVAFLRRTLDSFDKDFKIESKEGVAKFVKNIAVVYLIMEGTWFFNSFAAIMALCRQNKLPGLYDQVKFTLKDEDLHVKFGLKIINQLKEEYPDFWTEDFKQEIYALIKEGLELEKDYAREVIPKGILGLSSDMMIKYAEFLADSRLAGIGLSPIYNTPNPFEWLIETQDLPGMAAFFERREKSYQHSCNLTDDL